MKEKLQLLMEQLRLKPGQFARILEINPAIISHILAERNKPGVDLLQKILSKFPQVSPDWLLLDSGEMFRNTQQQEPFNLSSNSAQQQKTAELMKSEQTLFASNVQNIGQNESQSKPVDHPNNLTVNSILDVIPHNQPRINKPIIRVVLFYADGTFDNFIPSNKE